MVGQELSDGASRGNEGEASHASKECRPIEWVAPLPLASAAWKRALDLVVSIALLLVAFPAMLLIAVLVKLTSKGPIIYRAQRIGLSGKRFYMFKFRSMFIDADDRLKEIWHQNDHDGPVFKIKNDPRITPVGGFLRRFSLDELPQFLNVVYGEMSLVGPRALHDYEIEKFDDYARERLAVKPGITCYWQIMGRSNVSFEQWMELDHRYLRDASIATDLKILAKTPKAVMFGTGAY